MSLITEIDITSLVQGEDFTPFDLSNSRATLGEDAGRLTWNASLETAQAVPSLIPTAGHKEAFRDWVESSGGWSRDEIDRWNAQELNALLLQWIASEIRECFGDSDFKEWDWAKCEEEQASGLVPSNLFRAADGRIFFTIHN